jgi:hypothetical protein
MSYVDFQDIADVVAIAFTTDRLPNATFELAAPGTFSREDLARIMSRLLDRSVRAEKSAASLFESMPQTMQRRRVYVRRLADVPARGELRLAVITQPVLVEANRWPAALTGPGAEPGAAQRSASLRRRTALSRPPLPLTSSGSAPLATAAGSGSSGGACDRSASQTKDLGVRREDLRVGPYSSVRNAGNSTTTRTSAARTNRSASARSGAPRTKSSFISDAHTGLKQAIAAVLLGAAWQRCRVHFLRNVLAQVPKGSAEMVAAAVRTIFAQPKADMVVTSPG